MKKYNPSNKALILIPYWDGDRVQAIALSHLLADLTPTHSEDFDLLFVSRFDAALVDQATIKYVSRKFNVYTHISRRKDVGWPGGCSGLFFGAMEFIFHKANAGTIPGYKFIFNCAGDSIPLSRDSLAYLHRQWSLLNSKKSICMAGALVPDGGKDHINGDCCLITGQLGFLKWLTVTVGGMRARVGWDFGLARDFRDRGWSNVPGIRSFWSTPTMTDERIAGYAKQGVLWMHGVKDASALRWARANLV